MAKSKKPPSKDRALLPKHNGQRRYEVFQHVCDGAKPSSVLSLPWDQKKFLGMLPQGYLYTAGLRNSLRTTPKPAMKSNSRDGEGIHDLEDGR